MRTRAELVAPPAHVDSRTMHRWYFCSNPKCGRYIGGCLPSCPGHASGADHVEYKIDSCHVCRHKDPNAKFLSKRQRRELGLPEEVNA